MHKLSDEESKENVIHSRVFEIKEKLYNLSLDQLDEVWIFIHQLKKQNGKKNSI